MSSLQEVLERAGERMRASLDPLKQSYDEVEQQIAELEASLVEARQTREKIRKLIRQSDPGFGGDLRKMNGKAKIKLGTGKGGHRYTDETIKVMTEWFQSNALEFNQMNEGKGFYSTQLVRSHTPPACKSQSAMSYLLNELHARGVIRLNSTNARSARFYKVVV